VKNILIDRDPYIILYYYKSYELYLEYLNVIYKSRKGENAMGENSSIKEIIFFFLNISMMHEKEKNPCDEK
jgi:hypothetical protein